jgi:hypothetical protein
LINAARKPVVFYIGVAFSILFLGFWIVKSYYFLPHDFANSYFAGWFFLQGDFDIDIFDPYTFNKRIFDAGFKDVFASYNPNPPSTALFFSVLSLLSLPVAKLVFNVITSVLFLISIYRLCKHINVDPSLIFLLLPIVFFIPLRNQLLFGQTYLLLIFLLIEGFIAYENKKLWLAAALWSIAIFLKLFPVLIILFLLVRKEWRTIGYLAVCGGIILIACVSTQGIDVWSYYVFEVIPRSNAGEVTTAYEANFQSAQMFLKFLFVGDSQLNPSPLIDNPYIFTWGLITFKTLVIVSCVSLIINAKSVLSFGVIFLSAILVLSYGNTYGNLVLIIILIALWKDLSWRQLAAITLMIFLISNVPLGLLADLPPVFRFPRLLLLIFLFVYVFVLMRANFEWKYLLIFLPLLALPALFMGNSVDEQSRLLSPDQNHSLVFDYEVIDEKVVYHFWTDQGRQSFTTGFEVRQNNNTDLEVKENQIFYKGQKLTFGNDNKKKAMLLNDDQVVYLSDKDRGLGFYTLRVIDLRTIYRFNPPS